MKFALLLLIAYVALVSSQTKFGSIGEAKAVTSPGQTRKNDDVKAKFDKWKKANNKKYKDKEAEARAEKNFSENEKAVESHNQRKNETFKRGECEDADMTYEEKKAKRMGLKVPDKKKTKAKRSLSHPNRVKRDDKSLPESVDYRPQLSAIKNQADCGACWSFASTSVLEYQIQLQRNKSITLSEQELIDCNEDDMSCDGGWPTLAYNYIIENGLGSDGNYEFLAYNSECLNDRIGRVTQITDTCELEMQGDEDAMKWLVATYGPVVVTVWATDAFTSYKSGVYFEKDCPQVDKNHAIAIVGYGTDPELGDYWWIRNSWGKKWGIEGYGMYRRFNNTCGITNNAMFPCDTQV